MNTEVSKYIDEHLNEMLSDLSTLVSINSVKGDPHEDAPFGEGPKKALETALKIGEKHGFTTKMVENVMGEIDMFPDEQPLVTALAHLDVVPAGDGWRTDPFNMILKSGRVYGRGTTDDKGPAMCVLYAMKAVKACRVRLNHNFRLLLGTDEECGSKDLQIYMKNNAMSPMVFTPDASFPVINIEKGHIRGGIYGRTKCGGEKTIASCKGGSVVNQVPAQATATVAGFEIDELELAIKNTGFPNAFTLEQDDVITTIKCVGKNAHASWPVDGINAVTLMVKFLSNLETDDETATIFKNLTELFPHDEFDGTSAQIKMSDKKSGSLTCVFSVIDYACGELNGLYDIRFPLCGSVEGIKNMLKSSFAQKKFEVVKFNGAEPHEVDESSPFIKTLNKVFEETTGMRGGCVAIGGGTYVHNIEGGVAFGAEYKGENNNIHGANEFASVERLKQNIKVYAEAIIRLCK